MSIKSKTNSISSNTSKNSTKLTETVTDENEPRARLCHLKKWQHFQGYGFNLHAERAKSGQHIGKVDANSPAESAGLKEGDRIVEVNYVNISNENHQQVVKRIRNGLTLDGAVNENEVVLLVVDNEADEHYKKLNIIVKHDTENVFKLTTIDKPSDETISDKLKTININEPQRSSEDNTPITTTTPVAAAAAAAAVEEATPNQQENKLNTSKSSSSLASSAHSINHTTNTSSNNNNNQDSLISNSSNNLNEIVSANDEQDNKLSKKTESTSSTSNLSVISSDNQSRSSKSNVPTPTSQKKETTSNTSTHEKHQIKAEITNTESHLNNATVDPFQMSAAEFKTYLKSKSRNDPRIAPVDMKQKFQMFQDM